MVKPEHLNVPAPMIVLKYSPYSVHYSNTVMSPDASRNIIGFSLFSPRLAG